jgi:hypothetical protein
MKRPEGVTFIAIWFFIEAFFTLMFLCAIIAFPFSGVIDTIGDPIGEFWVIFGVVGAGIFFFATVLLLLLAGWGLLRLSPWSRYLALVLAFFSLLFFPIGTLIGIIIIWYLLKKDVRQAFEASELAPYYEEMADPRAVEASEPAVFAEPVEPIEPIDPVEPSDPVS